MQDDVGVVVVMLRQHFAIGRQIGQHAAILHSDFNINVDEPLAEGLAHRAS